MNGGYLPAWIAPSGDLTSYTPTLRERMVDALRRNLFSDDRTGQQRAERVMGLADLTPAGLAPMAYDIGREGAQGNYAGAGLKLAMAMAPMPKPKGIRAFHGSPHDFDHFSMDRIGTGEGAQAYGHGLYFAENEGVARDYRNRLSPPSNPTINGSPITKQLLRDVALDIGIEFPGKSVGVLESRLKSSDDAVNYIEKLKSIDMEGLRKTFPDVAKDVETEMAIFSELERRGLKIDRPDKGRMYEVNINADPNDFLDWDKPLSEQPESVRRLAGWTPEAEAQYRAAIGTDTDNLLAALEGNGNYTEAKLPRPQGALPMDSTGGQIYESSKLVPGDFRDKVAASRALKEAGIPGIKYLDAGSRAKGDGSRNYVVFDDKLITILRKYGLAGLVPAGLLAANQDQGGQQ